MVKRSTGIRSGTRSILSKHPRERGMPPVTHTFQEFKVGEKAAIVINPSVHGGQPHRRFQGLTGVIIGKQGRSYKVELNQGDKQKIVLAGPEHLKRMQ